jgi:hypothetical protein
MLSALFEVVFGCKHRTTSFPITAPSGARVAGETYVACLDCGKEFKYDWGTMRIGEALETRQPASGTFQINPARRRPVVTREA